MMTNHTRVNIAVKNNRLNENCYQKKLSKIAGENAKNANGG